MKLSPVFQLKMNTDIYIRLISQPKITLKIWWRGQNSNIDSACIMQLLKSKKTHSAKRKVNSYWAERLMFNMKGHLKALDSVGYCNGVFCKSFHIILSPYFVFRKLAYENAIEFFPFRVGYSGMVFNFWNIAHLFLNGLRLKIFSLLKCVVPFVSFSHHWL